MDNRTSIEDRDEAVPAKRRALVADDEAVSRMVVAATVRRCGFEVETAIDGLEAVDAARRAPFDVYVLDLQMPHLDGLAAAREIRAMAPGSTIIGMSATVNPLTRDACHDAGCDACVEKPIDDATMARLVGEGSQSGDGGDAGARTDQGILDDTGGEHATRIRPFRYSFDFRKSEYC